MKPSIVSLQIAYIQGLNKPSNLTNIEYIIRKHKCLQWNSTYLFQTSPKHLFTYPRPTLDIQYHFIFPSRFVMI